MRLAACFARLVGSPTPDSLKVVRLLPLHWRPVINRALYRRVDFFRRQKDHGPYARSSRLTNGECHGGRTLVVRKVDDGEGVMVAEGEVEVLEPSSSALGSSCHGFASSTSALAPKTFDALNGVRRLE
jgi:hypothetical protein